MTTEKLAQITQAEFIAVRSEIREGFDKLNSKIDGEISLLRRDMEAGFQGLGAALRANTEILRSVQADVMDLRDIPVRVARLEKKTGITK